MNADDTDILAVDQGSLIQYNLIAYCLNDPVKMVDHNGYMAEAIALSSAGFAKFVALLSTIGGASIFIAAVASALVQTSADTL